jgi:amino acid adenylation domain-containing protein
LHRVRETALEAYAHQDLPFEKLVEELQPRRELSYTPLFQVMFALQNVPRQALKLSGLSVCPLAAETGAAKFDLSLTVCEEPNGLQTSWEYNTDLFDRSTITRMSGNFRNLLDGIVANPAARLSDLPLLTAGESKQLLVEWNETRRNIPPAALVHQLFEAQVQRTPDAIGVVYEQESLTYQELNGRANQLANHLRGLGVGPEVLVGICMERSLALVIGLLGILKAGGAYAPLDPSDPKERLAFMIADGEMPVLLTQAKLAGLLPKCDARVLYLDDDWKTISAESQLNLAHNATAENLAYVIHTSGSTGRPKGVMVTHRALSNHMLWMQRVYPLTASDHVLQKTPFNFDASVWEFYSPLLAGGRLVMARPGGHQDADYLIETIIKERITVLQLVPSMLRALLAESRFERCHSLKRVFCGGEALPVDVQERFFVRLPETALHNLYGPTEATIDATSWDCVRSGMLQTVPIGRPIDNTQIYILDVHQRLAPMGVPGELVIGGAGLARGYLTRPDLTAEKFVPDPFNREAGSRLYRTGDLARYLSNGAIQFLGRIDQQVKIRGFRIELGEIEAVMSQHTGVTEAVAMVREDTPENKQLVAYVVGTSLSALTTSEFRSFLKKKLPDYMIPGVFIMLETLPLSANGKLDRSALPASGAVRAETFAAPRTPIEKKLAEIFVEVLKTESVGMQDCFFELGGHSLSAMQVVSRVRNAFRVELSIPSLFQSPTIIELAAVIEEKIRDQRTQLSEQAIQGLTSTSA